MASPVDDDDLLSGCVKYLLSIPEIVSLVGSDGPKAAGPFIWQEAPLENMEQQAETAIVVMPPTSWGASDDAHTQQHLRIGLEFWTGPIRDALGNVIEPAETRRRMNAVYREVDRFMHRPDTKTVYWGTVRTYWVERIGNINRYSVGDAKELVIGQVFYGVVFD